MDAVTGAVLPGWPVLVDTDPAHNSVYGAPVLFNNFLYIATGSHCDQQPYYGHVTRIDVRNQSKLTWYTNGVGPTGPGGGGIWGWGGVSVDPADGTVFTGVGNSHVWSDECACYVDNAGFGNQIVALPPDLSSVLESDAPDLPTTTDDDFGAAPLLFQPRGCPPLAAMNNKIGALYIWNRHNLAAGPVVPPIPLSDGISAFVGSPSWNEQRQLLFDAQAVMFGPEGRLGNGVQAFSVDSGCQFRPLWKALVGDGNQATPLVAGDVVFATGGKTRGFFALSALNGRRLWTYPTVGRTVAAMITVGGMVFGADTSGWVYGFRPSPQPPPRKPLPPTPWRLIG
jgi:outer membrane protein assembly factor BamB